MRTTLIAIVAFAAIATAGFVAGWWWRGETAKNACRQAEGTWRPNDGYCVAPKLGEMQT